MCNISISQGLASTCGMWHAGAGWYMLYTDVSLIAEGMGTEGYISVTKEVPYHSIVDLLLNATEELGVSYNPNYNGKSMLGEKPI